MSYKENLLDYVKYETTSYEDSETIPSNPLEKVLSQHLVDQLHDIGVDNAFMDEYGYVYAHVDGNCDGKTIGLIAHVDTSDAVSGKDVKPRIIENYDGKDIQLNKNVWTTVERFPMLKELVGKDIVVTDGNTLLGADDKAGVAIIMDIVETLVKNPNIKHGPIWVCFNPDEEIGQGTIKFNYDLFKVDFAYTLDGSKPNWIECENFNAASATVNIKGISTHPGSAKDCMINAATVGMEFHSLLDPNAVPEHTENYEGFNHLTDMNGCCDNCVLNYIIRNHDLGLLEKQKNDFRRAAKFINEKYGLELVDLKITESYRNMKEKFVGHTESIELVQKAMAELNMEYVETAIRGGTDGAALTWNGVLCPNLGTGGDNFHGIHEFVCLQDMGLVKELVLKILSLAIKK